MRAVAAEADEMQLFGDVFVKLWLAEARKALAAHPAHGSRRNEKWHRTVIAVERLTEEAIVRRGGENPSDSTKLERTCSEVRSCDEKIPRREMWSLYHIICIYINILKKNINT